MVADAEGSSYVGGGGNKGEEGLMQASMDKQLTRKQQVCGFGCGGGVCECEGVREWVSGWGCGQCVRGWGRGCGCVWLVQGARVFSCSRAARCNVYEHVYVGLASTVYLHRI